jgi:hypothetical protein
MIMQKETEKKYRVILLDARHDTEPESGKEKSKRLSQKGDFKQFTPSTIYCRGGKVANSGLLRQPPASVQLNVTKWFMLYSCPLSCLRLALRATEREREACRGHKIKKPGTVNVGLSIID